jgi:DNA-binding NarL/FixJ family response regulator
MEQPESAGREDRSALVGIRHPRFGEGIRDLVATRFGPVVTVSGEGSLVESAERLQPLLAVVDLAFGLGDGLGMLRRLHHRFPGLRLIVLSLDVSPQMNRAVLAAGADRLILASAAATELLPAAEALVDEKRDEREVGA